MNISKPLLRYRFSVTGMTLGSKWEQLFYVYLAQAAHEVEGDFECIYEIAKERLEKTDKKHFLTQVATGTVTELVSLKLWKDAIKVILQFSRNVDLKTSVMLLAYLFKILFLHR